MLRKLCLAAASVSLLAVPNAWVAAQGNCQNCDLPPGCRGKGQQNKPGCERVALTIESDIDFGRLVLIGDGVGRVLMDIQTGEKRTMGGLSDLGGMPVRGKAVVRGAPLKAVRVSFPTTVVMRDPAGGRAELRDFETDLSAMPILDATGELTFHFTGTLHTDTGIAIGGNLRGRVPISVSYD